MDGIINFHKPIGITSAKALYRVRRITGQRKSGHAGSLDPAADGVLILCLGRATRLVERLMDQPKVYRATARLDVTSTSYDSDRPLEPVAVARVPDETAVRAAAATLEGVIQQAPPAVSAIKIGGRAAYDLERAGKPPELAPRPVRVYWLEVTSYAWPALEFAVACGRGTYVRALIRDLGAALGTGGCLTGLTRTRVGPFALEEAWTFEALEGTGAERYLLPLDEAKRLLEAPPVVPERPGS